MALDYRQAILDGSLIPMGYTQMAAGVASTATGLQSIPTGARYVWIIPTTQGVRFRDDGTSPTASVGMPIAADQGVIYAAMSAAASSQDLTSVGFKLIEQSAGAIVNLSYYR